MPLTHIVLFDLYDLLRAFRGDDEEIEAKEADVMNLAPQSSQMMGQVLAQNLQLEGHHSDVHVVVF